MTTTPTSLPADQRQAAARDACRASLAEGVPLTGAELGRQFGLSPRWGRNRVAEVHAEATAATNGSRPTARHADETIGWMTTEHLERTGQTHDNRTMQTLVPIRHRRGAPALRHHGPGVPHRHG